MDKPSSSGLDREENVLAHGTEKSGAWSGFGQRLIDLLQPSHVIGGETKTKVTDPHHTESSEPASTLCWVWDAWRTFWTCPGALTSGERSGWTQSFGGHQGGQATGTAELWGAGMQHLDEP